MAHADLELLARIAVGFGLAFVFGFERQLRGSPAGDRTFSLVGAASAGITAVAYRSSPQAIAGVVTGIGFIGGGVVFHGAGRVVTGVTTAATIFATAAVGIVVGFGHLLLGTIITAALLITLELPHIPVLRRLDARQYADRFSNDPDRSPNDPAESTAAAPPTLSPAADAPAAPSMPPTPPSPAGRSGIV